MSDLAHKLRMLRGKTSADDVAAKTGLSRESIFRIERGDPVKLATVKTIATALRASASEWSELLVAWLTIQAGHDARNIRIESLKPTSAISEKSGDWAERATALMSGLPTFERTNVMFLLENPELIAWITPIRKTMSSNKSPLVNPTDYITPPPALKKK